jgi:hypothetical protein
MIRFLALFAIAAIYGIAGEFVFRRLTDFTRLRHIIDKMIAHALELPLFFDEPAVVWRAQRSLMAGNLRLLRQIALPCLVMAAAFFLIYRPMDKYFGRRPLAAGESAVITSRSAALRVPNGIVIETPAVRVLRTGTVSWRVRALTATAGNFPYDLDVHYSGSRAPWLLWFSLVSMAAATGISLSR